MDLRALFSPSKLTRLNTFSLSTLTRLSTLERGTLRSNFATSLHTQCRGKAIEQHGTISGDLQSTFKELSSTWSSPATNRAPVGVFWDYENLPVPKRASTSEIVCELQKFADGLGDLQLIRAYGQDTSFQEQKEIRRCNVELVVVPPGRNMADNAIKKDAERFLLKEIACLLNSGRDSTEANFEHPIVVILSQDRDFFPFITTLVRAGVRVVTLFSLTTKQILEQSERLRSALMQSKVSLQSSEVRAGSVIMRGFLLSRADLLPTSAASTLKLDPTNSSAHNSATSLTPPTLERNDPELARLKYEFVTVVGAHGACNIQQFYNLYHAVFGKQFRYKDHGFNGQHQLISALNGIVEFSREDPHKPFNVSLVQSEDNMRTLGLIQSRLRVAVHAALEDLLPKKGGASRHWISLQQLEEQLRLKTRKQLGELLKIHGFPKPTKGRAHVNERLVLLLKQMPDLLEVQEVTQERVRACLIRTEKDTTIAEWKLRSAMWDGSVYMSQ